MADAIAHMGTPTPQQKGWKMPKFKLPGKLRMPRTSNFTRLGNWATRKKNNMGNTFGKLKADVKQKIYKMGLERNFAKANNRTLKARTYKLARQARNKLAGYGATAWGATKKHMYNRPKNYIEGRMSIYTRKRDLAKREEKILLEKYKVTKKLFTNDKDNPALTIKLNASPENITYDTNMPSGANMTYTEFMNDVESSFGQDFIDAYTNRNTYGYNFFNPTTGLQTISNNNVAFKYTPSIWAQIDVINRFYETWKKDKQPVSLTRTASVTTRTGSTRRLSGTKNKTSDLVPEEEPLYYTDNEGIEGRSVFNQTINVHYTPETNPIPYYIKIDIDSLKTYINNIKSQYPDHVDIQNMCANILQFLDTSINTETKVDNLYPGKCTDSKNTCNSKAVIFLSKLEKLKWTVSNQGHASQ